MVAEESAELVAALAHDDIDGIADAVADSFYVLSGVCVSYGLNLGALLLEVHLANMEKIHDPLCADNGKPVRKPRGWKKPRIRAILEYGQNGRKH
jgi:predicted HAD superfamily Cof-like phosphohydrolase